MADFTHSFEFKMDDIRIEGEVEFNTDGTTSYKTNDALPRMTVEKLELFNGLFVYLKRIFDRFENFEKIEIKKL